MDGIYLIDKEPNMTSHDVVNILRKKLKTKRIGHAGTLDPMATGLLVILVGKMTKLSDLLLSEEKSYTGTIKLGISTDTYDHTGKITKMVDDFRLSDEQIDKAKRSILQMKEQVPPIYSAIKVDGKKLYEYARKDQEIEIEKRPIDIKQFDITNIRKDELGYSLDFLSVVSKGTYIRSVANDFGNLLDIPAHLTLLRRTASGQFNINDSYKLSDMNEQSKPNLSLESYASKLDVVILSDYLSKLVKNGIRLDERQSTSPGPILAKNKKNEPLAIYIKDGNTYKPIIQFE